MKQSNIILSRYASTAALAAAIACEERHTAWEKDSLFNYGDAWLKNWAGDTTEQASKKLSDGDAKLAAGIKAEGDILKTALGSAQPRIEVAVVGCLPSVPNYLRGVPANMLRVKREPRRTPVVDIYVETSIYDRIDTKAVTRKAAIIANAIAATELAGVRVNLYVVNSADGHNGKYYGTIVKLKEAHSPLNLLNIAFPLCSRAMHRVIFLQWLERHADERLQGYGRPLKGKEVAELFDIQGVVLSIRDLVDNDRGQTYVTKQINDYLREKCGAR